MRKGRAISNYLSLSLMQVGNYLLPVLTLPIIARIIGVENYGLINYAFAFTGYFMLLINAGFDMYGCRQVSAHKDDKAAISKVVCRIFSAKAVMSVVASFCFAASIFLVPQLRENKMLAIVTFLLCFGWVCNPSWLFHAMKDSGKFAIFSFVSKLAFSILVVVLVQNREDYLLHPLLYSVSHIVVSVLSFRYAMKKYGVHWTWCTWTEIGNTIRENRRLSLISVITQQGLPTNIVIAGILLSSLSIGYFSAAIRVVMIAHAMIIMPLATVMFPYVASAFGKSRNDGMRVLGKIFPYLLILAAIVASSVCIFSETIITILFGQEFGKAIGMLQIFSIGLFFAILNYCLCQQALVNMNREGWYVRLLLMGAIINIALLPLLIQNFGFVAGAWGWTISEMIVFSVGVFYMQPAELFMFREFRPRQLVYRCYQVARIKVMYPNIFQKK